MDTIKRKKFYTTFFISFYVFLFGLLFFLEPIDEILAGYKNIFTSSSILLTDYLLIGGISATIFNLLTTTGLNILILKWMKVEFSGGIFACLLTIAGFSLFGKNLYNALPIYLGVFLYAKASKTSLKSHVLVFLLSSGISPITSYLIFGAGFSLGVGILLGILIGVFIGFVLPAFNAFSMKFHQGYNLYNTGFSMGVLSMMVTGVLASFGRDVIRNDLLSTRYHDVLLIATLVISLLFILLALIENRSVFNHYSIIFKKSGRLLTDFFSEVGIDVTLLNIGIMGLLSIVVVLILGININGPVMGAILTILGFSAFGKHPLNSFPVILGAILAIEFTSIEWTAGSVLAVLFVTGIAPIAGQYGFFVGIVVGFVHVMITPLALSFQGGFDLYNNGFAAGFVAAVFAPVLARFLKPRDESEKWNYFLPFLRNEKTKENGSGQV
ncbi:MAG: DUF1576 domain-containing protein [Firmicutes bacterium]|nr:DUF1576 domain-containing protein [Bacillota bacterium]